MIHRCRPVFIVVLFLCGYPGIIPREIQTLHPDPLEEQRKRILEYSLENCFQFRRAIPKLILSETPSSEWYAFSYREFIFRFGPGGRAEIDSTYNPMVFPSMNGSWIFSGGAMILTTRYRQFLIGPCMATCMAGSGYIYPAGVEPGALQKWGFKEALGKSNSCKMHCFSKILEDYGKTFVDFELQLKLRTNGPSEPAILIEPVQYSDSEPVAGKKGYVVNSFSVPLRLHCQ